MIIYKIINEIKYDETVIIEEEKKIVLVVVGFIIIVFSLVLLNYFGIKIRKLIINIMI